MHTNLKDDGLSDAEAKPKETMFELAAAAFSHEAKWRKEAFVLDHNGQRI